MHRTNPAERALQTYKSFIKSTIASLPPTFTIALWCKLLPQINLSVNIVRKCRQNSILSAWAAMEGKYHFDSTPIAPAGTDMLMHENPGHIWTFGYNTKKAWYIAPCFCHYRTFKGIMASTGAERISDTVKFKHRAIAIPQITPADRIFEATRQLDDAIRKQPKRAPMDELTDIELLRIVLMGEKKTQPPNSMQLQKTRQAAMPPDLIAVAAPKITASIEEPMPDIDAAHISDDEDGKSTSPIPRVRCSRRFLA